MKKMLVSVLFVLFAVVLFTGCSDSQAENTGLEPFSSVPGYESAAFYKEDGSMDQDAAKQAYYEMMRAFNYPIPEVLKTDNFWVADFVQGDFANLGMGGIFWVNESDTYGESGAKAYKGEFKNEHFGYLGHDIYLLPGQVLPEHHHIGGGEGWGPKMESWHVRHGSVEFFAEFKGEAEETLISDMPASERPWGYGQPWFKCKYVKKRVVGETYTLNDPEGWHFMRAGKDGAIVSEYATYHNHVSFSKPGMVFDNTKAK